MTTLIEQQIVAIHILPNISRKGDQIIGFCQSMDYNMGNIFFFEKLYKACGEEASLRPCNKMSQLNIFLNRQSEMI